MSGFTYNEYVLKLASANQNIAIIGEYTNLTTRTLHKCKVCGYEWIDTPSHILEGRWCSVCSGHTIGIAPKYTNSIWASEYKDCFSKYMSEKQMKEIMPHSGLQVEMICPDCNNTKLVRPNDFLRYGFNCVCDDGKSYPNKFLYGFLNQLKIEYSSEQSFNWSNGKIYDIYIPSLNCIIENHGCQHYIQSFATRSLEEEKENDRYKESIAKENGIENYIVIDCRNSNKEWIKNSIMKSVIPDLFAIKESDIDWDKIDEFAVSNMVKAISELWNNGLSVKQIEQESKLCRGTIIKYLKKSNEFGWCDYSDKESRRRGQINRRKNKKGGDMHVSSTRY